MVKHSMAALLVAALSDVSHAAISNTSPNTGDTVTVDTSAPNPDTRTIVRFSTDNVTVNILAGASITDNGAFTIAGGENWTVDNAGSATGGSYAISVDSGQVTNTGTITADYYAVDLDEGALSSTGARSAQFRVTPHTLTDRPT